MPTARCRREDRCPVSTCGAPDGGSRACGVVESSTELLRRPREACGGVRRASAPSSAAQLGERRAEGGRGLREEVALEVRHRGPMQGECAVRPDHVRDAESDAVDAVELGEHGGMGLPEMLPISGKDCSMETRTGTWNPNTAHSLDVDAVVEALHAPQTGLTSAQVYQRREELGSNSLPHGESKPAWRRFLGHLEDVLIYILLTAAVLKALTGDRVNFAVIAAAAGDPGHGRLPQRSRGYRGHRLVGRRRQQHRLRARGEGDRKSTRLNSSHVAIS